MRTAQSPPPSKATTVRTLLKSPTPPTPTTATGSELGDSVPSPRSASPQQSTPPVDRTAQKSENVPVVTDETPLSTPAPSSLATWTGTATNVELLAAPSPSTPSLLTPQQSTPPDVSVAQKAALSWYSENAISFTPPRVPVLLRFGTGTGVSGLELS